MPTVTIQRGDTLSKLVAQYNQQNKTQLTVADVAKLNGLRDPNKIIAGKTLKLGEDSFQPAQKAAPTPGQTPATNVAGADPVLQPLEQKIFDTFQRSTAQNDGDLEKGFGDAFKVFQQRLSPGDPSLAVDGKPKQQDYDSAVRQLGKPAADEVWRQLFTMARSANDQQQASAERLLTLD